MFKSLFAALLLMAFAVPVYADDGGSYFAPAAEAPCGSDSFSYDPGKTAEGFQATASDGCHTVEWTSNTVDQMDKGTVTFHTIGNIQPGEAGYDLPGPEGGNFCQYRAAHEANMFMTNHFKVPVGTEVTVSYRCY